MQERPVGFAEANTIVELSAKGDIVMLISDLTIANTKYSTRKSIPLADFYSTITALRELFVIVPIGAEAVDHALALKPRDFEDALQCFSAEQAGADCLLTRN
ncbi:MAG: hypothetical protein IJ243_01750 [Prevotella sp.]|nr:hypothetical protein [Prevotella sp.]